MIRAKKTFCVCAPLVHNETMASCFQKDRVTRRGALSDRHSVMDEEDVLDERLVKDLVQCSLCSSDYSEPRVLPCHHTFCLDCLTRYYDTRQVSSRRKISALPCPTCSTIALIPRSGVASFPADTKALKIKKLVNQLLLQSIVSKCASPPPPQSPPTRSPDETTANGPSTRATHQHNGTGNTESMTNDTPCHDNATGSTTTTPHSGSAETGSEGMFNFSRFLSGNRRRSGATSPRKSGETSPTRPAGDRTPTSPGQSSPTRKPMSPGGDYHSSSEESSSRPFGIYQLPKKPGLKRTRKRKRDSALSSSSCHTPDSTHCDDHDPEVFDGAPERNGDRCAAEPETVGDNEGFARSRSRTYSQGSRATSRRSSRGDVIDADGGPEGAAELLWKVEKSEYDMPTGVVFMPDDLVVVAEYGNSLLQYYTRAGRFVRAVDGVKPFGIATDADGVVVLTDRREQTVKLYDRDGHNVFHMDKEKFKWSSGVAVNSHGQYVLCDRDRSRVSVYEATGELVSEFGSFGPGDHQFCMADFLAVDSHDRIVLSDSANHCVKVFSATGELLLKCGGRGSGDGQLLWPKGVCVDGADNIFVCDSRNDRVSLFAPDGQFIQHILVNWPRPYAVSYHAPNLLAVTQYSLSGTSLIAMYSI
ncbi:hypothetical protein NP493_1942g00008 [Ridgeia piscesae]|uniref:RING-type domain-containing protein n=1 Tax=Ridgeia piscesae TaxID=27915 RepID=A0AAD9JPX4_RIDPI|nr:hypothetical protein NP493_1942g00008 [Ridgeia piscesae]